MLFHVSWETYPTAILDDDKRVRDGSYILWCRIDMRDAA
jgi:hypothetical protein